MIFARETFSERFQTGNGHVQINAWLSIKEDDLLRENE
jgi:hypothetical protein